MTADAESISTIRNKYMQKIYHGDTFISRKEGEKRGFFTVTELDWDEHDVQ